jgi:hypothetical protein
MSFLPTRKSPLFPPSLKAAQSAGDFQRRLAAYEGAIEAAFGSECDYGQIVKTYVGEPAKDAARRYAEQGESDRAANGLGA